LFAVHTYSPRSSYLTRDIVNICELYTYRPSGIDPLLLFQLTVGVGYPVALQGRTKVWLSLIVIG
jgi:hypothetical protein